VGGCGGASTVHAHVCLARRRGVPCFVRGRIDRRTPRVRSARHIPRRWRWPRPRRSRRPLSRSPPTGRVLVLRVSAAKRAALLAIDRVNLSVQRKNGSFQSKNHSVQEKNHSAREKDHSAREKDHSAREKDHSVQEQNHAVREQNHSVREENHVVQEEDHSVWAQNRLVERRPWADRQSEPTLRPNGAAGCSHGWSELATATRGRRAPLISPAPEGAEELSWKI